MPSSLVLILLLAALVSAISVVKLTFWELIEPLVAVLMLLLCSSNVLIAVSVSDHLVPNAFANAFIAHDPVTAN